MRSAAIFLAAFVAWLATALGCGSARRGEPIAGPFDARSDEVTRGRIVFMRNCNPCHPNGEGGVGPSVNDKKLIPGFLIRTQVRAGIGAMPSFKRSEISDEELGDLIRYVMALRHHG